MKTLIEKYPKIFQDYEGNTYRVNWSCPSGWINIVDEACHLIQSHIDNKNNWATKLPEIGLAAKDFLQNEPIIEQLICHQIKEKFGGLRFYTDGGDDFCQGVITYTENLSFNTCENCGSNQNIGQTRGWIATVCINCKDNYKNEWKLNTK